MKHRQELLARAAQLPADAKTPDWLLFAEGIDPSDTYIGALADVRYGPIVATESPEAEDA